MAYDDVIRVADLKTRRSRFERVQRDNRVGEGQIVYTTEYMHPRLEEVAGTLPAPLGRFLEAHPAVVRLDVPQGPPRALGHDPLVPDALRAVRCSSRSAARRCATGAKWRISNTWLALAAAQVAKNYDVAVEIINTRRLVKGYSDTHARGESKFDRVIGAVPLLAARADGADWMRRLRDAALIDEKGIALDGALKTIATL